ncbi:hypothetical protein BLNAU_12597 [Blattamonas nauphoetae]|uniref:Uncharacterized protein n=1 Tax=Blattamonas nauphoetae TaxID=2049346 RepID=A0ABQ9XJ83_9EUKA|nr:hypothetical protein BLNAU_12597 [Blattamonas nauphoetae]
MPISTQPFSTAGLTEFVRPQNKEEKHFVLCNMFYVFFFPFIFRCKPITNEDIWPVSKKDSSQYSYDRTIRHWNKRYNHYIAQRTEYERQRTENPSARLKPPKKPGFFVCVFMILGNWRLALGLLLLLAHTMTHLLQPIMEEKLVDARTTKDDHPTTKFPVLAGFVMMFSPFIHSAPDVWGKHILYHYSTRVRAALSALIFEKTLKLNLASQKGADPGSLLSLLATDSRNIAEQLPNTFHLLWIPVQFFAPLSLIIKSWGWTSTVAVLVIIVMLPMQITLTHALGHALNKFLHWNDERNSITEEIISGIRVIKYTGMEDVFYRRVERVRTNQLKAIFQFSLMTQFLSSFMKILPLVVNGVTMTIFIFWKQIPQYQFGTRVIPQLGFLSQMTEPFDEIAELVQSASLILIGQRRIKDFLLVSEKDRVGTASPHSQENAVEMTNASFRWPAFAVTETELDTIAAPKEPTERTALLSDTDRPHTNTNNATCELSDITLSIPKGSLAIVVGRVGCGKSSFGSAVLGDMECITGDVRTTGNFAYCPQTAWITNNTIRGNILFGLPYEEHKYNNTIRVCSLTKDFTELPAGDLTAIGERGVNLSGGQKARIQLARAVYADRDVVVLDDPLSAVDAHVGRFLMDECICGALKGKTVILMTNQAHHQSRADIVITIENTKVRATHNTSAKQSATLHVEDEKSAPLPEPSPSPAFSPLENKQAVEEAGKQMIVEEEFSTKAVPLSSYIRYFRSLLPVVLMIALLLVLVFSILLNSFAAYWKGVIGRSDQFEMLPYYLKLGVYVLLPLVMFGFLFLRSFISSAAVVRSGKRIHDAMLQRVLHAPISFFDTTPMGRILNRFTGDMTQIDQMLLSVLMEVIDLWLGLIGNIVVCAVDQPLFISFAVPILLFFVVMLLIYARASRNLLRLESISRSRVLSMFGETCVGTGVTTIRTYGQQDSWTQRFYELSDEWSVRFVLYQEGKLWSSFYACWIATLYMIGVVIFGWNFMDGVKFAIAIETAMEFSHHGQNLVRQNVDLDSRMTSFERVQFYSTKLPQETATSTVAVDPSWPERGDVSFENVSFRYRSGLPHVLKHVNLAIRGGEKVGVCGRTGAGKTSLLYVLFRLIELDHTLMPEELDVVTGLPRPQLAEECNEGRVVIDGVDISKVELNRLRRSLAIIPQDPTLFTGSVRYNLDLEGKHSDDDIWRVLETVEMGDPVRLLGNGLDSQLVDGAKNLSAGQRQLLCFARAILNRSQIVVLDEATANVDGETDNKIQKTVREQFKNQTVLVIAHRLNTIMDSDKIAVIGGGKVLEFDTPAALSSDKHSELNKLLKRMESSDKDD